MRHCHRHGDTMSGDGAASGGGGDNDNDNDEASLSWSSAKPSILAAVVADLSCRLWRICPVACDGFVPSSSEDPLWARAQSLRILEGSRALESRREHSRASAFFSDAFFPDAPRALAMRVRSARRRRAELPSALTRNAIHNRATNSLPEPQNPYNSPHPCEIRGIRRAYFRISRENCRALVRGRGTAGQGAGPQTRPPYPSPSFPGRQASLSRASFARPAVSRVLPLGRCRRRALSTAAPITCPAPAATAAAPAAPSPIWEGGGIGWWQARSPLH